MAQAVLADHHYEVAMKTFSRQPRMLAHNGLTVMVYDVDLRDDDRHRINYDELLVDWTRRGNSPPKNCGGASRIWTISSAIRCA